MMLLDKIFVKKGNKTLGVKDLDPLVARINELEPEFEKINPRDFPKKTEEFKKRLKEGETLDDLLPEAFALVREAAKHTLGQRPFDVQLMGGITLHRGRIAEMKTGEGKTLVATLPVYLNALTGRGVHVITVNDYLSRRDTVLMGQVYHALGLGTACINADSSFQYDPEHKELDEQRDTVGTFRVVHEFLRPIERKQAYEADITYGTNNEFGFDYLRDHISAYKPDQLVQREHHFTIVDEVDSILIDESRTPLIISAPAAESEKLYEQFARIVAGLKEEEDYTVDEKFKAVQLTDSGIEKAEQALGLGNIYTDAGIKYVHHLETAARAKGLFHRDRDYVVRDGQVIIVDEFTGRLQPGRRWSEGLHQAVEAKEGVPIQKESRTAASITFQNYFRMYEKLSGMTGTAATSSEEFFTVYGLEVVEIPTNRPMIRKDHNDLIFQSENGKFTRVAREVKTLHEKGQPVLVGTASIEKNELLEVYLKREGVPHVVLNAKNHANEGELIANAGKKGAVTVATNLAGRGVDIKLGGATASKEEYEKVKELGGLYVIGTERHEARRTDNQLRGRSGRQGDPGESQFYVSLEDTLMRVFASDKIKSMMGRFNVPEDEPIQNRLISSSLESAQEKIEGFNFDARKRILDFDDVLNQQRSTVYQRRHELVLAEKEDIEEKLNGVAEGDEEFEKVVEEKRAQLGDEKFFEHTRRLMISLSDLLWMEHLDAMDHLRGSVNLRAYGQRDPLVEYKKEGLRMYKEMQETFVDHVKDFMPRMTEEGFAREQKHDFREVHENPASLTAAAANRVMAQNQQDYSTNSGEEGKPAPVVRTEEKVGRNDPCPCGSNKKYKKCHGKG